MFSQCIKLLGVVRSITLTFTSHECVYIFHFTSVRTKHEYVSVAWNFITSNNANILEIIQQKLHPPFLSLLSPCPLQLCLCIRVVKIENPI
jgi:hypothetical protein